MFRTRANLWVRSRLAKTRPFCTNTSQSNNNGDKIQSNLTAYEESYKQLDKLDFMTAAKMLFTEPPKKKKFGIDFHLVQLFFACMPSLAVYLVAQYARYEMKRMEAELEKKKEIEEKKKREEEEKAKESELKEAEEKLKSSPELLEMKTRLGKLEEAVKEIVVESKKESIGRSTKSLDDGDQNSTKIEPSDPQRISESSSSGEQDRLSKQKSGDPIPGLGQGKLSGAAPVSGASP